MRFVHADLDPRAKLAFAVVVAVLAVAVPRPAALASLAVLVAVVVAVGRGFGLREWLLTLSPFKYLVPIILVLNTVFYAGGEVLVGLPLVPLAVTTGGIETSVVIAARLLVIAATASWFAATTDPERFEVAITALGAPWGFAFLVSLTLRLVPEMRRRFRTIEDAQRSRGLDVSGGPVSRARSRIPMLIPFFVSVIEYGYELSDALTVRDFGVAKSRTHLVRLETGGADYLLYGYTVAVIAGFVGAFVL